MFINIKFNFFLQNVSWLFQLFVVQLHVKVTFTDEDPVGGSVKWEPSSKWKVGTAPEQPCLRSQ